jgi:uncharacterized protein
MGALSLAVGGIVGGGFFATFGLAIVGARGATWVSFLIGGAVALLTAYSYVGLTRRYPGPAGTVGFVRAGFGTGLLPSAVNVLLVLSYVAVMSVYALALGAYASSYLPRADRALGTRIVASAAIVLLGAVNLGGAALMARFEDAFNLGKLGALAVFVVGGFLLGHLEWERLGPSTWVAPGAIVANGMVVFLAYEGFELVSNASGRIRDPGRTLPVAYFGSILVAMAIYALAVVVALGQVPIAEVEAARDFALSAVAGRFLGPAGFGIVTAGAVLASASAINADFFGAEKLPVMLAEHGELPAFLARESGGRAVPSLVSIGLLALVAVNLVGLAELSAATSGGFLVVFTAVNAANARLARETGSKAWISVGAAIASGLALVVMLAQFLGTPETRSSAWAVGAVVALATAIALLARRRPPGSVKDS